MISMDALDALCKSPFNPHTTTNVNTFDDYPLHTKMEQVYKEEKGLDAHAWVVNKKTGEIADIQQQRTNFIKKKARGGDWIYRPFNVPLQNELKRWYGSRFKRRIDVILGENQHNVAEHGLVPTTKALYQLLLKRACDGKGDFLCFRTAYVLHKLAKMNGNHETKIVIGSLGYQLPNGQYTFLFGARMPDDPLEFSIPTPKPKKKKKKKRKKTKRNRKRKSQR